MIGFIILNYNTWEMTIRCVESISETCKKNHTIYIVDNGSLNDSYHQLKKRYRDHKNVVLIQSENLGYAKGNNIGIRQAIKDGHDIITIANNDVIFLDESIEHMHNYLEKHENVAVVSPYILSPEGELQNLPSLKPLETLDYLLFNTKLSKFASHSKKEQYNDKYYLSADSIKGDPIPIYKFSGCCFMARSEMLSKLGLFDEHTFLYYEEDILCHKMYRSGYKAYFLPESKIVHHHGLTTGKDNLFVDTEMLKSEIYFLARIYQLNLFWLLFIYADRAITPIMKKIKKRYRLTFTEYLVFLRKTWSHFVKYSKYRNSKKYSEKN
ncbi:glycosyltransferase family 2 protein [Bacillus sp. 1P10SD]|uniref:glycosyltransferase family 2 protein n=1 Tax=Bacillus sp. 1P10SD TaxID=3132265 RepID=UPI0039A657A3